MQSTLAAPNKASHQPYSAGKTSPASSSAKTTPLGASLPGWLEKLSHSSQVLDLNAEKTARSGAGTKKPASITRSGRSLVVLLDDSANWPGESSMPNTSAFHNDATASSLSEVLEKGLIPKRYYLSSTAGAGILRRAEKRGRLLPPLLQTALEQAARTHETPRQDI